MLIYSPVLTATKRFITGSCESGTLSIGDAIRVASASVAGVNPVAKVDIDDQAKMPAVGVVVSVQTPTLVTLQLSGDVYGLLSGMAFGVPVFIGVDGSVTQTKPSNPLSGYRCIQMIGYPIDDDVFLLNFQPTIKVLP